MFENEDGVEVDLGDLGDLRHEGRDAVKDGAEGGGVERCGTSVAGEQGIGTQRLEHLVDVVICQRGDTDSDVVEHLDRGASAANDDERPHEGIPVDADDHLETRVDLLLHQELAGGVGEACRNKGGADRPHRRRGPGSRGDASVHAADVALVDGRSRLDDDGAAECELRRLRFLRRRHQPAANRRDTAGLEDRCDRRRVQPDFCGAGIGVHDAAGPPDIDGRLRNLPFRSAPAVVPSDGTGKGAGCVLRGREGRNPGRMQHRRRSLAIHEHTDQGDIVGQCGAGGDQFIRDVHRSCEQRGVEQHHHGIHVWLVAEDACDVPVLRRGGAGDHVDGVGHTGLGREQGPQPRRGRRRRLGNLEAVRFAGICGEDPRPTAVGDDRYSAASVPPGRAQHRRQVEHLLDRPGPDDARLAQQGVHSHVAAR